MSYQINNHLQLDGDTVDDEFRDTIIQHPTILKLQKQVKTLESMVIRLHSYIQAVDKAVYVETTNQDGETVRKHY